MNDIKREMLETFVAKSIKMLAANTVRNLLALLSMMRVQAPKPMVTARKVPDTADIVMEGDFSSTDLQNVDNFLTLIDLLHPST